MAKKNESKRKSTSGIDYYGGLAEAGVLRSASAKLDALNGEAPFMILPGGSFVVKRKSFSRAGTFGLAPYRDDVRLVKNPVLVKNLLSTPPQAQRLDLVKTDGMMRAIQFDVVPNIGTITPLPLVKSFATCELFHPEYFKLWVAYDTAHWKPAPALSCPKSTELWDRNHFSWGA